MILSERLQISVKIGAQFEEEACKRFFTKNVVAGEIG
jgi:hypothetical protein